MNEPRGKKVFLIAGVSFAVLVLGLLIYYFISSGNPSTQKSDKTVVIDNYKEHTQYISSNSYGYLGNYLYEFIKDPKQGVYHAEITKGSYSYDSRSWFSKFVVKLKDGNISWNISMQTLKNGDINGDIRVTCESGDCISASERMNSNNALQDELPITTNDFIISQGKDDYKTLTVVYYDTAGEGKTKALEKIKSLGFKPEDYTIKYFYGGR